MKKKESKADFLRGWGLPYPHFKYEHLRYKTPPEKGVYWYYFSLYVRLRDVEKYGTCISCGKPITMENTDAGHFMPAESCGRDLLFDERNVNAECKQCNAFDSTHLLSYAENLDKRYGEGTSQKLRTRYMEYKFGDTVKDWKREQYVAKIKALPSYKLKSESVKQA